jgi:hypothetical protein
VLAEANGQPLSAVIAFEQAENIGTDGVPFPNWRQPSGEKSANKLGECVVVSCLAMFYICTHPLAFQTASRDLQVSKKRKRNPLTGLWGHCYTKLMKCLIEYIWWIQA